MVYVYEGADISEVSPRGGKRMSEIYYKYRVFREQIEFDPDVDYWSAACYRLPEFILIKKEDEE